MKPKSALIKIKALLRKSSFTSMAAKKLGVSSATLAHYVKTGELLRIGHGVYRGVNAPTVEDFRWEDLLNTVSKVKGGVVCLTTALALYELTDEIPRKHWIAISNHTSHRADDKTKIIRLRNMELGRSTINIDGFKLPIFDRERTIVDAFRFLSIETAVKALRNALKQRTPDRIQIAKIRRYSKILRVNVEPFLLGVSIE